MVTGKFCRGALRASVQFHSCRRNISVGAHSVRPRHFARAVSIISPEYFYLRTILCFTGRCGHRPLQRVSHNLFDICRTVFVFDGRTECAPTAGCPRRQSTLPLVTSLTLYKRPTLLALNVIYGYGYRAVSSVLFTVYCDIGCADTAPRCRS